jgi:hypothetical protein
MTKSFISYSWDDDSHKEWVRNLATRLRKDGVDITLDQWHIVPGDQIPEFMEKAVRESDYVLIICTQRYKNRSDNRRGGVGYEGDIMTAEVMNNRNQRKFIPILKQPSWNESAPSWLSGKYYINLSSTPYSESQYGDLLTTLLGKRQSPPPIGKEKKQKTSSATKTPSIVKENNPEFSPIQIIGVIVDEIGIPHNDGTRGSALYEVPFRLSQRPPYEWGELFIHYWNNPLSSTFKHRPGTATVIGEKIILNRTTVEEVEKYHRETLIQACSRANEKYKEFAEQKRIAENLEQKRLEMHRQNIEDISKRIKFD